MIVVGERVTAGIRTLRGGISPITHPSCRSGAVTLKTSALAKRELRAAHP